MVAWKGFHRKALFFLDEGGFTVSAANFPVQNMRAVVQGHSRCSPASPWGCWWVSGENWLLVV